MENNICPKCGKKNKNSNIKCKYCNNELIDIEKYTKYKTDEELEKEYNKNSKLYMNDDYFAEIFLINLFLVFFSPLLYFFGYTFLTSKDIYTVVGISPFFILLFLGFLISILFLFKGTFDFLRFKMPIKNGDKIDKIFKKTLLLARKIVFIIIIIEVIFLFIYFCINN